MCIPHFIEREIGGFFPLHEDEKKHIDSLDCPCRPVRKILYDKTYSDSGRLTTVYVLYSLQHNWIVRQIEKKENINSELFLEERDYQIQDAASLIRPTNIKPVLSRETATLLFDQIENMYEINDCRYTGGG